MNEQLLSEHYTSTLEKLTIQNRQGYDFDQIELSLDIVDIEKAIDQGIIVASENINLF